MGILEPDPQSRWKDVPACGQHFLRRLSATAGLRQADDSSKQMPLIVAVTLTQVGELQAFCGLLRIELTR